MSDSYKEGKRRGRNLKTPPENVSSDRKLHKISHPVGSRHVYGHTEKILGRCRKIWTRLLNKRRRQLDKSIIEDNLED